MKYEGIDWKLAAAAAAAGYILVRNLDRADKIRKQLQRDTEIAELFEAGYPQTWIGARYRLAQSRVSNILAEREVAPPNRKKQWRMWQEYLDCGSIDEVADMFGEGLRLTSLVLQRLSNQAGTQGGRA